MSAALDALKPLIGTEIGCSEWVKISQDKINVFADVTEDWQFIHVDPERAKDTPFGGPIAHGFLTLSLLSRFAQCIDVPMDNVVMGVNYGFEKVRFLSPVPADTNVRGRFVLKDVVEKSPGQFLLTYGASVEIEGQDKPALVADWLGMQIIGPKD